LRCSRSGNCRADNLPSAPTRCCAFPRNRSYSSESPLVWRHTATSRYLGIRHCSAAIHRPQNGRERGSARCQMQKSATGKFHDEPSIKISAVARRDHSPLIPAVRITLPHFSISSAMSCMLHRNQGLESALRWRPVACRPKRETARRVGPTMRTMTPMVQAPRAAMRSSRRNGLQAVCNGSQAAIVTGYGHDCWRRSQGLGASAGIRLSMLSWSIRDNTATNDFVIGRKKDNRKISPDRFEFLSNDEGEPAILTKGVGSWSKSRQRRSTRSFCSR
jgi:hypothetical protein